MLAGASDPLLQNRMLVLIVNPSNWELGIKFLRYGRNCELGRSLQQYQSEDNLSQTWQFGHKQ